MRRAAQPHNLPGIHPTQAALARPAFNLRPTRFGGAFLCLILLTLIGAVNYALSLGYGLTFLLGGVWVMTATQATRAARSLAVSLGTPPPVTVGQDVPFTLHLRNQGPDALVGASLRGQHGERRSSGVRVRAGQTAALSVALPTQVRGLLTPSDLRVYALDSLGLWMVGVPAPTPVSATVYPLPEVGAPPAPSRALDSAGEDGRRTRGDQEFAGLRPYTPGDSPRQVSWRHVARTGHLLTRETDAPQGRGRLLDWADTVGANAGGAQTRGAETGGAAEARLSRLAAWANELHRAGQPYGLRLPGQLLAAGQGEAHLHAALGTLALHAPLPSAPPASPRAAQPAAAQPAAMRVTLLALAVTLLPAALRQPLWTSLLILALMLYSAAHVRQTSQEQRAGRKLPALPTWLLGLLAGLSAVGLYQEYGTLLGRDAGTAFLALLLGLKAAETRTRRDAHLLILLGLFMTSTHFFHDQGPLSTLGVLLGTACLLVAAGRWVVPHKPPAAAERITRALWQTAQLLLLATPLALTLFVLFPRPERPLWQLPLQAQASTGLANEISAGEYSNLAQNRAVAFRADFAGALPPPDQRYWRGPVYEAYTGQTWQQVRIPGDSASVEPLGPTWNYTLTLEPHSAHWLLALDVPTTLPERAFLSTAFQAVTQRPVTTRRRLTLQSRPALLGRRENAGRMQFNLQLPPGQSPRALALAQSWQELSPQGRVQAALEYLQAGGFTYTLSPPLLPENDRVDAFLFGSKTGFCEHYASAFAFLMRAAGVPTRLVGGYLGGEVNPDGGYLIVRQQDAHAWTEVWLEGQGWVRVDPTAVVAPARVNAGLQTALTRPQAASAPVPTGLSRLRLRADALQNQWNNWVAGYDAEQQGDLLTRSGLGKVGSSSYLLALPLLTLLALLPALVLLRRQIRPSDPAAQVLHALSIKLKLPRHPGETPTAYAQRARERHPHLAPALQEFVTAYHAARYAPATSAADTEAAQKALKSALGHIKP